MESGRSPWLPMRRENGRKQKRNLDADCGETSRATGSRRETEASRAVWRPTFTVTTLFLCFRHFICQTSVGVPTVSKLPSSTSWTVRMNVQSDGMLSWNSLFVFQGSVCICLIYPLHEANMKYCQKNHQVAGVLPKTQSVTFSTSTYCKCKSSAAASFPITMLVINDKKNPTVICFHFISSPVSMPIESI